MDLCQTVSVFDHCDGSTWFYNGVCEKGIVNYQREEKSSKCGYQRECNSADWQYSPWSECDSGGKTNRKISKKSGIDCIGLRGQDVLVKNCEKDAIIGTSLRYQDEACVEKGIRYKNPSGLGYAEWTPYFGEKYTDVSRDCNVSDTALGQQTCSQGTYGTCLSLGKCASGYVLEGGQCINTKQVDCTSKAPTNATAQVVKVSINYSATGVWSSPSECNWTCNSGFTQSNSTCIQTPSYSWKTGDFGSCLITAGTVCNA